MIGKVSEFIMLKIQVGFIYWEILRLAGIVVDCRFYKG